MVIEALDPADTRQHEIAVAGPAALLVAKLHKIHERIDDPRRNPTIAKDALDILRIHRGCTEDDLAERLNRLLALASASDDVGRATGAIAHEATGFLRSYFATPAARGCDLAVRAGAGTGDAEELRASLVELVRRLLKRIGLVVG